MTDSKDSVAEAPEIVRILLIVLLAPFLTAALLKPKIFAGNNNESGMQLTLEDPWVIFLGLIIWAISIAFLLALMIAVFMQHSLLNFEKVIFSIMCFKLSIISLIICNYQNLIVDHLKEIEQDHWEARDDAMHNLRNAQATLAGLNQKIGGVTKEETTKISDLLKAAGPVAIMLLNKERNLLRWGFVAADLARKGMAFMQSFNK